MFAPFDLPDDIVLLVTDELASPADFVLYKIVNSHFKANKSSKCLVASVLDNNARWKAIAARSNVNLDQKLTSGSLIFVDILSQVQPPNGTDVPNLSPLLDAISSALSGSDVASNSIIIVDDTASLQWIGFSTLELTRFCRALRALCLKLNGTLILRHHIVTPAEPDDLFRHLLQLCTYHMDVRPLSSGKSGAVSGEVALHAGPNAAYGDHIKLIPRSAAIQYRLTESGAVFFERGTGGGVL